MTDKNREIQLGLSSSFLNSLQSLPPNIQAKTFEAISRFQSNPDAGGRNLEKINNQMMSMRIDLAYRAILGEIEDGKGYLILWVDHHDEAYQWAERRKLCSSGSIIQVIQTENATVKSQTPIQSGLFTRFSNRHLRQLGVLEEQLSQIKSLQSEAELAQIADEFHPSVYEALCYLSSGIPIEEIIEMMGLTDSSVDRFTSNISSYINTAENRQSIVSINNELDLINIQHMLEQPLESWRIFLHASQRKLVEAEFNGPVKVIGGAGTGKTIMAIHRAKFLVEHVYSNSIERVLITTFTVNLAAEIENSLRKICQPSVLSRIDVLNADKLVVALLKNKFPSYQIAYGDEINTIWQLALEQNHYVGHFSIDFFRNEWSRVVVPQKVRSLKEYLRADRTGRGIRLSRPEKATIWSIFATYLKLAEEKHIVDIDLATSILTESIIASDSTPQYASIIVDEAQDFNQHTFRFLRSLCGTEHNNDMFIVGDAHQRIYRNQIHLSQCGIETRGRSHTLRINYRTTEQIRRWSFQLFSNVSIDDLDDNEDNSKGYISLTSGPEPEVVFFKTQEDEINKIAQIIQELISNKQLQQSICIAVRTAQILSRYKRSLENRGIRLYEIKPNNCDQQEIAGVRIATMHRVKGLEFDHMILGSINDDIIPLQTALGHANDPVSYREADNIERSLLYVAASRAKKTLHVLGYGKPSRYLKY